MESSLSDKGDRMEQNKDYNDKVLKTITDILLEEEKPSIQLSQYSETEEFKQSVFSFLNRLKETEQSKQHHPEGNVWIHTLMVVDEAAQVRNQSKEPDCFMWGALLHDVGKPDTFRIRKGKITTYDHDKVGAKTARRLLEQTSQSEEWINKVCALVRWHMQILFIAKDMSFADLEGMKQEVDLDEIALLGTCDRMGRLNVNRREVLEDIKKFRVKSKMHNKKK